MAKTLALLLAFLAAATQNAHSPAGVPTAAEFPPQDHSTWMQVAAGLKKRLAARQLAEAPGTIETLTLLAAAEADDEMLRTLAEVVEAHPRRMPDAFAAIQEVGWRLRGDGEAAKRRSARLREIIAGARRRLPELSREEAATAERVLMTLDERPRNQASEADRLRRFVGQYRGTRAALLAEVDLITTGRVSQRMLDELEAFAQAHPGTDAAAKALYQAGFHWHTINTLGTIVPRDADPIARFERVLAIVRELESGRYPDSEWVSKAPDLLTQFFIPPNATIPPASIDRFIEVFEAHAAERFALDEAFPDRNGIGYLVTSKIADLYDRRGERTEGVERTLSMLERRAKDPAAVRLLRGLYYLRSERQESTAERTARLARARDVLRGLAAEGRALSHRRALATLAALDFEEGEYTSARASFRRYAEAYPTSSWTWLARLRVGQCEEALGNFAEAAGAYLNVAGSHMDLPIARVLGHAYAARALETEGELQRALAEHERALAAWDNTFGPRYTTNWRHSPKPGDPFVPAEDAGAVVKASLAPRIAQLKRSLAQPGGSLLEHGRALLERGRLTEARLVLQRLLTAEPTSPAALEGRELLHRVALHRALQLANRERSDADEKAAERELLALAQEPTDFAVTAAKIALASLHARRGDPDRGQPLMRQALADWHEQQDVEPPATDLERDVAEIREAVFLPFGGEIYRDGHWNAFDFPSTPPAFMLLNSGTNVKLQGGEVVRVDVVPSFDLPSKVVFFDADQIALLKSMILTLGGTARREPGHVMETPNQPVGDSTRILDLWKTLFPARPGHWGGWEIETYPVITEIEFTDADRTRAAARVTIGYSGATVELEKEGDRWIAKRLTNRWIT